ncbi:MAG TPA: chemotaxis protein CheA [Caulobacteraceae bacterium]|nr:chemotaxis protein CheA [Caulobacteraceae bacterium]
MSDPLAEIKVTFFQECEEQLSELESGLLAMDEGRAEADTVNAVFRAVHSIKGGAGAFSLEALVRFSHVFENVLDDLRSERLEADGNVVRTLLRAADMLADHVRVARDGGAVDEARSMALVAELKGLNGASAEAADDEPAEDFDIEFQPLAFAMDEPAAGGSGWTVSFKPHAALYASANETALLLRELERLGTLTVELDVSALPPLDQLDPEASYLAWTLSLQTDKGEDAIREVFEFVEGDCDLAIASVGREAPPSAFDISALLGSLGVAQPAEESPAVAAQRPAEVVHLESAQPKAPAPAPAAPAQSQTQQQGQGQAPSPATIRVDLDRVDRLIDLVGELVINQAMLAQRVSEMAVAKASNLALGLEELEHLTREIQDSVMAIRAQPVKSVFQRMPRLVREVAGAVGKEVRLITDGEGTEVDKTVIEKLTDPLTHMIRNAIDHGLETPDVRVAAGKPAEGTVRLSASHRSGRIVIEIADDGAGINRERVRAKAVEKGLIAEDAVLTDEEIDNLVFAPGFSTAAAISDISGRGVGMDVVKRSIQALGGRISIVSTPGKGSIFTMSLPLTLAVLDGMVVSVGGQTVVAPLTAIIETLEPKPADLRSLGASGQLVTIRNAYVPLVDVAQTLGFRTNKGPPAEGVVLLVERDDGSRVALLVDDIQGQRQVVIKSLEANYRQVEGIAAATILGDGRVALILDIDALVARRTSIERSEKPLAAVG